MTCDRLERDNLLGHLGEEMDPHVEECSDCRSRRAGYDRLAEVLRRESDRPLPADWKKRTVARLRVERMARRRRQAIRVGMAATATAGLLLFVTIKLTNTRVVEPDLQVSVEEGPGQWRGPAHEGDLLQVAATGGSAEEFELRIYRDAREIVLRCPGQPAPACRPQEGGVEATWTLASGEYDVIVLVSSSPLPAPRGDLEADLRAARSTGARIARQWSTHVY